MNRIYMIIVALISLFAIQMVHADGPDTGDVKNLPAVVEGKRVNVGPNLSPPKTNLPDPNIDIGRGIKVGPQGNPPGVKVKIPTKDLLPDLEK